MVKLTSLQVAAGSCGANLLVGAALLLAIDRQACATGAPIAEAAPADAARMPGLRTPGVDPFARPYELPLSVDMLAIPEPYRAHGLPPPPARDFDSHGRSKPAADVDDQWLTDGRLLRNDSLGQRLATFRARNRVRVMTLWETGGSSLSLQAGRRGDPSLQWTSRTSNHGVGARGLLDEVLRVSVGGLGKGLRWLSKSPAQTLPASASTTSK